MKFKYEIWIGLYVGAMSVINKIIPVSIALLKIIHSSLSGSCNSNCSSRSQFQNLLLRNTNCGCCGKEGSLLLLRTFEVFELHNNIFYWSLMHVCTKFILKIEISHYSQCVLPQLYLYWQFGSKTSTVCFCSWNWIGLNLGSRI